MRRAVPPRIYSVQLSMLANLLRTVESDKRLTAAQFNTVNGSVDAIVRVLSEVQQLPLHVSK